MPTGQEVDHSQPMKQERGGRPTQSSIRLVEPAQRRRVSTVPYAVFVHGSAVYRTSEGQGAAPRGARPGKRLGHSRHQRQLPWRPDGYPYANRRWSKVLMAPGNGREDA